MKTIRVSSTGYFEKTLINHNACIKKRIHLTTLLLKLTLLLSSVTLHSVVDSFLGPGFAPADSAADMGAPAAFPWTPWPLGSFLSRADLEANEDKLDLATLKSSTGCFPDEEVDKLALGSRDPPRPASSRVRFSLSRLNLSPADTLGVITNTFFDCCLDLKKEQVTLVKRRLVASWQVVAL